LAEVTVSETDVRSFSDMSSVAAFFELMTLVVIVQVLILSSHIRRNRDLILSVFGSERTFWLAGFFPIGELGKKLSSYPHVWRLRRYNLLAVVICWALSIFMIVIRKKT
jgi:hypothetical protein